MTPENHSETALELEFELARLDRHLQKHPEQAHQLAMNHYEDYLCLARDYRHIMAQLQQLKLGR